MEVRGTQEVAYVIAPTDSLHMSKQERAALYVLQSKIFCECSRENVELSMFV